MLYGSTMPNIPPMLKTIRPLMALITIINPKMVMSLLICLGFLDLSSTVSKKEMKYFGVQLYENSIILPFSGSKSKLNNLTI